MGKRRGRPVNGILVLNKPGGMSSNGALQRAKRLFTAAKAGHTGSLDPLATGVLPLCFGEATKFSQFLLDSDKAYRSTFTLGVTTASGDADGEMLESLAPKQLVALSERQVAENLKTFCGTIEQVPSMFSAIKHQGQPLYKLARQGIEVERKRRTVTVFELQVEAFRAATENTGAFPEVDVYIHCSKGTYVRSIAEDLGRLLGCGAHVKTLHRVKAGPFDELMMVTLEDLQMLSESGEQAAMDQLLAPMDIAVRDFPAVQLSESSVYYLQQGQAVRVAQAPVEGQVRIEGENGDFLGIGEMLDDGRVTPKRLVVTH